VQLYREAVALLPPMFRRRGERRARLDELRRLLLRGAADLAYHDDALRLRVLDEPLEAVHKVRPCERGAGRRCRERQKHSAIT
jgi:hypothetical protein